MLLLRPAVAMAASARRRWSGIAMAELRRSRVLLGLSGVTSKQYHQLVDIPKTISLLPMHMHFCYN